MRHARRASAPPDFVEIERPTVYGRLEALWSAVAETAVTGKAIRAARSLSVMQRAAWMVG